MKKNRLIFSDLSKSSVACYNIFMKLIIAKNYNAMSILAASLVIKQVKQKPASVLGLPTGHTPEGLYRELTKAYRKKIISFRKIRTFNLDEYVGLNINDKHSYHAYMNKFFQKIDIDGYNINIPNEEAVDLKKECANYENLIKKYPIDLLILGIGHDGHLGFNEPGSSFTSRTRVVDLLAATRRANAVNFDSLKSVPKQAITMGLGTIIKAKKIILLASGEDKAEIIRQALQNRISKNIPASILQKHPDVIVIVDVEAGKLLKI